MKIIVCIKQVPDTTEVKIDPETNTLVRQGIQSVVNPFDSYALEEGVRLKEQHGGQVTVISMGPPQAETALREALATGADEAILLSDRAFAGADTLATAYTLARAIDKLAPYDLVICGRQTTDGDTGQVGPEVAEILGLPFVAYVSRVEEIAGGQMRVRRMVEEGHEVVAFPLPGVITVAKDINVPRLPSLRGKMKAKSAAVPAWTAADLAADADRVGMAGSATRVTRIFYPQRTHQAEIIPGDPDEQVERLMARLREAKLI
ncbi:MAG: electron transfer flavoprotein subunit beta/FixA family protein [Chloroflexota bacterium]